MKLKDWQERALKTFVQAFGGIMIPAIVALLGDYKLLTNWTAAKAILAAALCSGLAAGISAAWNILLEHWKAKEAADEGPDL